MGAISYNIEHNIHGRFVTCQRPIIFTVYCDDVSVIRLTVKTHEESIHSLYKTNSCVIYCKICVQ